MQELELTWSRFGKTFWFCFWRMTVFGFIGGAIANFVLHWLLTTMTGNPGLPAIGAIVWIPISILVLRMALLKKYREFRIALVSTDGPHNRLPNCVLTSKDDASP
ncbi:MAG: hypothetical protein ABJB01_04535 [Rudaea sp.]